MLSPQRSMFWQEQQMLILSDLHLGKAGHFRKHGIPIPRQVHVGDLQRINALIETFTPEKIVFLGDLFHSDPNDEWTDFQFWAEHVKLPMLLIRGNHDILGDQFYLESSLEVLDELHLGPFHFTHEPIISERYNIAGHIHPAYILRNSARQSQRYPCFYFGDKNALMPSFGDFTGSHAIRPKSGERVVLVADEVLVKISV